MYIFRTFDCFCHTALQKDCNISTVYSCQPCMKEFLFLFFYFLLLAVLGLHCCPCAFSSCGEKGATLCCGARAYHCSGFSCCGAWALGARASVVVACGLSSCGARAQLLHSTWDLPGPGIEPMSPALAGGFLTTASPGKSPRVSFFNLY